MSRCFVATTSMPPEELAHIGLLCSTSGVAHSEFRICIRWVCPTLQPVQATRPGPRGPRVVSDPRCPLIMPSPSRCGFVCTVMSISVLFIFECVCSSFFVQGSVLFSPKSWPCDRRVSVCVGRHALGCRKVHSAGPIRSKLVVESR